MQNRDKLEHQDSVNEEKFPRSEFGDRGPPGDLPYDPPACSR
jgi:hypothetical protein